MCDVAAKETGNGWRRAEEDVVAAVVGTCETGTACVTGDVWLNSDLVTWLEGLYRRMDGDDLLIAIRRPYGQLTQAQSKINAPGLQIRAPGYACPPRS